MSPMVAAQRTPPDLQRLYDDTNAVISALGSVAVGGPVNWGDLSCTDAQFCMSVDGTQSYRVLIEEASPDAYALHEAVSEGLKQRGWNTAEVEISTEW